MEGIRLGYFTKWGNQPGYNFLEQINQEQFQRILDAIEVLNKYDFSKKLFKVVDSNYSDFFEYPQKMLQICVDNESEELIQDCYFNCNRLFINFLSSFRVYIDYIETYLKRKFGKTSQEVLAYKRCTAFFFDKFFAYRFLYKLRNYSQHCGFPINDINFSAKLDDLTQRVHATLTLSFNRDKLLEDYTEWGQNVKSDLENQTAEFDVMPLLQDLYFCISELATFLENIDKPSLSKSKLFLKAIIDNINKPDSIVCVFYNFQLSKPNSYENSTFATIMLNPFLEI